ncbi:MAG: GyrI-like domain-containing protein [archaeon]
MDYKIVEKDEFLVVGIPVKVSLNDEGYQKKIMQTWMDIMPRVDEIKNRSSELFFGICDTSCGIERDECSFESIAAVEVSKIEDVPEGMTSKKVPAAKYFVATHKGRVEKLGQTWGAIEQEMKTQDLKEDRAKIFFELYDERFKMDSDESEIDLYTPLE